MPESQTNLAWDVLLDLGRTADGPLHERLKRALRTAVRDGRIGVGRALPPSRKLAADLGCSRWAVTEAYGQLATEGYLEARSGSATRVRWAGGAAFERRPRSVRVAALASYSAVPDRAAQALVLGYGNLADAVVDEAVRRLGEAIREVRASP